jgi:hypothetical protein
MVDYKNWHINVQKDTNKHTANCKTSKKCTELTEINIKTHLQVGFTRGS